MALARCENCGSPRGLRRSYPHVHALAIPGNISVLCGSPSCARRALIWLTEEEEQQYFHGQRSFRISNRALELHVAWNAEAVWPNRGCRPLGYFKRNLSGCLALWGSCLAPQRVL